MIWVILAILLGVICALSQFWSVSMLQPLTAGKSISRIRTSYFFRIVLIGLYFWQLVQQGLVMILVGMSVFMLIYLGGVFFIALKKPHWLAGKEPWTQ